MTEAEQERARVAGWLRESHEAAWIACAHSSCLDDLADAIERGEHLKGTKP